jgi:hypothetical protein
MKNESEKEFTLNQLRNIDILLNDKDLFVVLISSIGQKIKLIN